MVVAQIERGEENIVTDPASDPRVEPPTGGIAGLKQRVGESRVDLMAYGRTPWS